MNDLISRRAAIEAVGEVHPLDYNAQSTVNRIKKIPSAREWIPITSRPMTEDERKWIPVTERLPEEKINPNTQDFEYVLCVTIWGDVRPYKYGTPTGHREAHFWNWAGYVDAYVTHWMPLPEPPKKGTGE